MVIVSTSVSTTVKIGTKTFFRSPTRLRKKAFTKTATMLPFSLTACPWCISSSNAGDWNSKKLLTRLTATKGIHSGQTAACSNMCRSLWSVMVSTPNTTPTTATSRSSKLFTGLMSKIEISRT